MYYSDTIATYIILMAVDVMEGYGIIASVVETHLNKEVIG